MRSFRLQEKKSTTEDRRLHTNKDRWFLLKYFSMFSGIGGFDLALNRQGHQCVGYSEINEYSIQTYKKNFGNEVKNYGDATKINPEELADFDLLCGGFPCQTFSIAGKRRGFEDTRGTLFFDIARIIKTKRPSYILLENVKGLLSHNKGQTFSIIINTIQGLGYDVEWMVLNSKFFGVPQNRERVFIVGSIRGKSRPEILPISECIGETKEFKNKQRWNRTFK
jgi:DNA (cytosine-5)-methyltransferase 1